MASKNRVDCPKYHQVLSRNGTKSYVWRYFGIPSDESGKVVNGVVAICKLCNRPASSKATSNLWSHLKIHHPFHYNKLNEREEIAQGFKESSEKDARCKGRVITRKRSSVPNMSTMEQTMSIEENESPSVDESMSLAAPSSQVATKRKSDDNLEKEILKLLKTSLNQQPRKIQDPDEMFLLSQFPQIKRMRPNDKLQFQIQFMQLIQKYSNTSSEENAVSNSSPVNNILSSTSRGPTVTDAYEVDEKSFSGSVDQGEKNDGAIEPIVKIKIEPGAYSPKPSTPKNTTSEEFILPYEENS